MKTGNGEITQIDDITLPVWERGIRQGGLLNETVMNQNLLDFKTVMDKYGIPFVFIFGSVLGIMRNGKPWAHPGDSDVDVMCFAENHHKMGPVVKKLRDIGFTIPDCNDCPMRDHFIIRDGEKIELWHFDLVGNDRYYSERVWYPKETFEENMFQYLDKWWRIPKNPELFVECTYGKDWKEVQVNKSYILTEKEK